MAGCFRVIFAEYEKNTATAGTIQRFPNPAPKEVLALTQDHSLSWPETTISGIELQQVKI
jgi:hypothetical protein